LDEKFEMLQGDRNKYRVLEGVYICENELERS